jgi:hypothetical protein
VELWQGIFLSYVLASVAVALADHLVDFNHVTNSLFLSFHHHKLYDPCLWHGYLLCSQPPSSRVNSLLGLCPKPQGWLRILVYVFKAKKIYKH